MAAAAMAPEIVWMMLIPVVLASVLVVGRWFFIERHARPTTIADYVRGFLERARDEGGAIHGSLAGVELAITVPAPATSGSDDLLVACTARSPGPSIELRPHDGDRAPAMGARSLEEREALEAWGTIDARPAAATAFFDQEMRCDLELLAAGGHRPRLRLGEGGIELAIRLAGAPLDVPGVPERIAVALRVVARAGAWTRLSARAPAGPLDPYRQVETLPPPPAIDLPRAQPSRRRWGPPVLWRLAGTQLLVLAVWAPMFYACGQLQSGRVTMATPFRGVVVDKSTVTREEHDGNVTTWLLHVSPDGGGAPVQVPVDPGAYRVCRPGDVFAKDSWTWGFRCGASRGSAILSMGLPMLASFLACGFAVLLHLRATRRRAAATTSPNRPRRSLGA